MTNSTPTRLLFRKKITAIYADGSSKMNLGIATAFILASITRTWKSSRIGSRSTKKPQAGWCLPPAWRPSSL